MIRHFVALASTSILFLACGDVTGPPSARPKPAKQQINPAFPQLEQAPTPISIVPIKEGTPPNLGGGALFSNAGAFNLNATNPGSASFTAAPVFDYFGNNAPASFGVGSWSAIVAGGNTFNNASADALAGVVPADTGIDYLLLTAYTEELDPATGATIGTVMHAIVLSSDFAVGASVNFDGVDRLAIFARGDISLPDPQIAAAAVTGTITFSAGGLALGDLITANLTGDFGEFTWSSTPPPPGGGTLMPGNYTLTYDPMTNIYCDGTLIGQEAAFAAITAASIGFADGPVVLAAGSVPGNFDISGAPITSGYGVATLTLESIPDAPGVVGAQVNGSGSGPLGTTFAGTYLAVDGTSATATDAYGWSGAGYIDATGNGFCSVDFLVLLGP